MSSSSPCCRGWGMAVPSACPRTDGDHWHKISARPLSNRGLMKVRRRRGRWSGRLTDTGRYYLENQRLPFPADAEPDAHHAAIRPEHQSRVDTRTAAPPAAKPKAPTESLVAAVVVAGRLGPRGP